MKKKKKKKKNLGVQDKGIQCLDSCSRLNRRHACICMVSTLAFDYLGYVVEDVENMCSNIVFVASASASRLLLPAAPTVYCIHVPLVDGTMVRGRRRYNYSYEVFGCFQHLADIWIGISRPCVQS